MNLLLKRSAEFLLVRSGLLHAARARRRGDALVLAYHNIVPHGEAVLGDASLHLHQSNFADQLDILLATHDVVPLTRMHQAHESVSRPRVVLTFDDAYEGALTAGVEELQRRALPATIFVAPEFVGGRTFWWDELAAAYHGALPERVRRYAIEQLEGRQDVIERWASEAGIRSRALPAHQRAAAAEQLSAAEATGLITFGSHSWSHANLCALREIELRRQLSQPMQWLQERFKAAVPWLSYPYGLSSRTVRSAAAEIGYSGALVIDGGWPAPTTQAFALPRANVPAGLSNNGFRVLASGLLPVRTQSPSSES